MKNSRIINFLNTLMALCLAIMAGSVFINVVMRYGFSSGIAASEELSRLLFVWMVFIGATAAYPQGEHMAFTSLLHPLLAPGRETALRFVTRLIHALVVLSCILLGWGAWQQVIVGMGSVSVVLGYRQALLPLPALLCSVAIGSMALLKLIQGRPIDLGHASPEVE
ncbi:MAG: TRAP transporter small permease subunit [Gammaproteobacteria bacterium]|uniref:TRAP transporter small permease subunit n=1 Tax=Rhodoferax sp. TaxID=50421 RepID=UPI0017D4A47D|nr:TRAP transporter small permease subunit [Rhodoferax sp.]MBU3898935.1 TRAP transporter small permease subunit [Gammaproteobacteria bacterium]MBA3059282.1 TRAP transporter small permease subunit [Rhodoferax sp.]MBU3997516.1 TRAP transporter small permease subunit [Gammaproteobacteria bacterium]MBU4018378.1 TRAP transporter small permease subunit [Gammaproteobacteria bacterium]MBU4080391.1 TRAP transporter small permease subunit [Gammaproteobacteria bacterium]